MRPREDPAFWHCWSRLVHIPDAQERPSPQDDPSLRYRSSGQVTLVPSQVSTRSQRESTAARQTVPFEATWHCEVQQSELRGSQTAPGANRQVEASQQGSSTFCPGSHSSPSSRMPFPHDCSLWRTKVHQI